jgi:hypothetical protein
VVGPVPALVAPQPVPVAVAPQSVAVAPPVVAPVEPAPAPVAVSLAEAPPVPAPAPPRTRLTGTTGEAVDRAYRLIAVAESDGDIDARFAGHLRAALAALVQAGRGDVRAIAVIMRLPSKYGAIMTGRS